MSLFSYAFTIKEDYKKLGVFYKHTITLLLDPWSIDLSGAREKEGHFHHPKIPLLWIRLNLNPQ